MCVKGGKVEQRRGLVTIRNSCCAVCGYEGRKSDHEQWVNYGKISNEVARDISMVVTGVCMSVVDVTRGTRK